MKLKKLLALLLAMMMAFALVACGDTATRATTLLTISRCRTMLPRTIPRPALRARAC